MWVKTWREKLYVHETPLGPKSQEKSNQARQSRQSLCISLKTFPESELPFFQMPDKRAHNDFTAT